VCVSRKRQGGTKRFMRLLVPGVAGFLVLFFVNFAHALDCPDRVLMLDELRAFVEEARRVDQQRRASGEKPTANDPVLHPSPEKFWPSMDRHGCLYAYHESEPTPGGVRITFEVDPYGDVLSVSRGDW
jgi:hypothetical protein